MDEHVDSSSLHGQVAEVCKMALAEASARSEGETGRSLWERALVQFAQRERFRRMDDDFRCRFPYCFHPLGGGLWLPLGRQYKPAGHPQAGFYSYEDHAVEAWAFRSDPIKLAGVWRIVERQPYLYREFEMRRPADFEDYFARLGRLVAATGDNAITYSARLLRERR